MGIRVSPKVIYYVIYDVTNSNILNVECLNVPAALEKPEALKYIRNNILDILREYKINRAGIRITEPSAQRLYIDRIQIEGVIQETFASSQLEKYYTGDIAIISSRIGIQRTDFKRYVENEIPYEQVDNWNELEREEREAIFAALGAAND